MNHACNVRGASLHTTQLLHGKTKRQTNKRTSGDADTQKQMKWTKENVCVKKNQQNKSKKIQKTID